MPTLRDAGPPDAEAIARLHVEVWRDTYRGIAPEHAFRTLDVAARLPSWQERLAATGGRQGVLLVEAGDTLAGIGHYGAPEDPAFGTLGEVKKLYVTRAFARQGIGRQLLCEMARRLRALGYPGVGLGVVIDNHPARAFYEAMGGRMIASYTDPGPTWRSDNVLYAWHDFTAFGPG